MSTISPSPTTTVSLGAYPYTVCTECEWEQFYHRGNERGAKNWGHRHSGDTGHTVRMKRHHEFADVLWTQEFVTVSYGEPAMQMWLGTLTPFTRQLVDKYSAGSYSAEQCEALYAVLEGSQC